MRSNFVTICLVSVLLTALLQPGCGSRYGEEYIPQIAVSINFISNPESVELPDVIAGQGATYLPVEIRNVGRANLSVTDVYLEEGGNPYISIEWSAGSKPDFPVVLEADDELAYIQMQLIYAPGDIPSGASATLVVTSNDPDNPLYRFTLAPPGDKPEVSVSPSSYTFLNATEAKPETQIFEITNTGSSPLKFVSVGLQSPNDEFTVLDTPAPGAEVAPPSENPGAKLTFKVRYQPKDDVIPDQAVILLRTNDPSQPEVQITVKSKVLLGKLVITYEDQAKGYVDFSSVLNAGEQLDKAINLRNEGDGPIRILGGDLNPDDGGAYSLFVQKIGEDMEEFTKNDIRSIKSGASLDVVVRYTSPGPEGADRELQIRYENPYQSELALPLVGGTAKPAVSIYPSYGTFQASNLQFHSEGEASSRTIVLANEGLAPATINDIALSLPQAFKEEELNFELVDAPTMPLTLGPLSLQAVTIRFLAAGDAVISKADLTIDYQDATDTSTQWNIALAGYKQVPLEGAPAIILPTANPGSAEDYADAAVGSEVLLSGAKSLDGDAYIQSNGYTWYLAEKPIGSAVQLNTVTGSTSGFIPDQQGTYKVILYVQTELVTTGDNTKYGFVDYQNLWSPEASVEILVAQ